MVEGEEGPELAYREYPWPDKDFFEERDPLLEERLPEIAGLEVALLARESDEDGSAASETWSPGDKELPGEAEIRLILAGEGSEEGRSLTFTVPLLALPVR